MIWFIGIALILFGYIAVYWRRGFTHPIPITLAYWIIILPGFYFLITLSGLKFIFVGSSNVTPLSDVNYAGMYIFLFLVIVVITHALFSHTRIFAPVVECHPRVNCALPAIVMMGAIIAAYVATNGAGALSNSLKLRTFTSTGFPAYLEIVLEAFTLIALIQACAGRSKAFLVFFLLLTSVYSIILARTGLLMGIGTAFLSYLCMVKRIVPRKLVAISIVTLFPFALLQGILRVSGGLSLKAVQNLADRLGSSTAWDFLIISFGGRVNQLNIFADMVVKLGNRAIPLDPLDPIYIFAQLVPRSVWPDKPEMFTDHMTMLLAPKVHKGGVVFNFIGPSELMYAYGLIAGTIVTGMLYGYIFALFDRYYRYCLDRPMVYLFFAVFIYPAFLAATQAGFFNAFTMLTLFCNGGLLVLTCRFQIASKDSSWPPR